MDVFRKVQGGIAAGEAQLTRFFAAVDAAGGALAPHVIADLGQRVLARAPPRTLSGMPRATLHTHPSHMSTPVTWTPGQVRAMPAIVGPPT